MILSLPPTLSNSPRGCPRCSPRCGHLAFWICCPWRLPSDPQFRRNYQGPWGSSRNKPQRYNALVSNCILIVLTVPSKNQLSSDTWEMNFKSAWVGKNIQKKLMLLEEVEIRQTINLLRQIPTAAALASSLLEVLAHRQLAGTSNTPGDSWPLTKMKLFSDTADLDNSPTFVAEPFVHNIWHSVGLIDFSLPLSFPQLFNKTTIALIKIDKALSAIFVFISCPNPKFKLFCQSKIVVFNSRCSC